ncbi:MAG: ABC transporter substrate-binding protein [Alphaproteobacteria bacterium]
MLADWRQSLRSATILGATVVAGLLAVPAIGSAAGLGPSDDTQYGAGTAALSTETIQVAQAAPTGAPISIGVVAPTSGDYAGLGSEAVNAINLAAEQINQKGGVLGRPLRIIVADGATDPTLSLNAVTRLTTQDKVVAVLGTLCTGCTLAAIPAIKNANVPHFTIGDGGLRIAKAGSATTFLVTDTDEARGMAFVDAVHNHFKVKNVGILVSEKSEPGKTAQRTIEKALAGSDVKVTTVIAPTNAPDYKPYLTTLRDAGAQVIFDGGSTGEEMAFILRQMQDLRMQMPTVGMLWVDAMVQKSSPEAASIYYFATPYLPTFDTPAVKAFTDAYKAKFQRDPSKYSAIAYSSTMILATAMEQAKSTDSDAVTAQVRKVAWTGPLGKPNFDSDGLWNVTTSIARYLNGGLVLAYTPKQ